MKSTPWKGVRQLDINAGIMSKKTTLSIAKGPIRILLPVPPSLNGLFLNKRPGAKGMGRVKSPAYRAWIKEATFDLRVNARERVEGRYIIDILVPRQQSKADIWNLEKAISDLLQKEGIIANDNLSDGGSIYWRDDLEAVSVTVTGEQKENN